MERLRKPTNIAPQEREAQQTKTEIKMKEGKKVSIKEAKNRANVEETATERGKERMQKKEGQ